MKRANFALAFWSLVLSTILWSIVFSQSAKTKTGVFTVSLEVSALESQLVVTKIPDEITISVTGSEEQLKRINSQKLSAFVDLSRATEGTRSYPVKVFPAVFQDAVGDQSITARVEVEPVTERKIAVTIDTSGELGDATSKIESILADPAQVSVYGPRSEVNRAQVVRGILNLESVSGGAKRTYSVYLEALGRDNRPLPNVKTEPLFARVSVTLGASPEEKAVIIVPSLQGQPAGGFSVTNTQVVPTQIMIRGQSLSLSRLSRISTMPINVTGLKANKTFEVPLLLPPGLRTTGPSKIRVKVEISPVGDLSLR